MVCFFMFSYYKVFKFINSNYLLLKYNQKTMILKNILNFYYKKNLIYFLNTKYKLIFIKAFLNKLFYFLKGFYTTIEIKGRRFKYFINKNFIFFKMDTSKFLYLEILNNLFIKKRKKKIKFFFFEINIFKTLKNIQKLKIPNKFTKKGIFFLN